VSRPVLYVFAISHYCEKARWALDRLNLDYDPVHVPPGPHIKIARKLGATRSSLPILTADDRVVQGSAAIIDWADAAASNDAMRLTPQSARQECREIESRVDDVLGVHIRRFYYSEALVEYPHTVLPVFTQDLPIGQRLLTRVIWGVVRRRMISAMDLGFSQGQDSKRIVDDELSWLDERLSDGRRYLAGDRFTRADLAVASLLAPLAAPKEHTLYASLPMPPALGDVMADWACRPSLVWTREIYGQHR
jgi:glutathione S-transferase